MQRALRAVLVAVFVAGVIAVLSAFSQLNARLVIPHGESGTALRLEGEDSSSSANSTAHSGDQQARTCVDIDKPSLTKFSRQNTLLIGFMDSLAFDQYGQTFIQNVRNAGIEYYVIAALDSATQKLLLEYGEERCIKVGPGLAGYDFDQGVFSAPLLLPPLKTP